jgi:hypothetical protein
VAWFLHLFQRMDLIAAVDGTPPESASAIDVLGRDHERVRELFSQYRRRMYEAVETCRSVAGEICMQWELHARLEREIFYPALGSSQGAVKDSLLAHHDIDECIAIIRHWPGASERDSTMLRLMQLADLHMAREEKDLFPLAKRELPGRLESLGREMLRRREALAGSTDEVEARS